MVVVRQVAIRDHSEKQERRGALFSKQVPSLIFIGSLFFVMLNESCRQKPQEVDRFNRALTLDANHTDPNSAVIKQSAKVNPNNLRILNLTIANYQDPTSGIMEEAAGYSIMGGADYVKYEICPLQDTGQGCPPHRTCTKGGSCVTQLEVTNRFNIPPLWAGQVRVSVQGCVNASKSISPKVFCGAQSEIIYNSHRASGPVLQIYTELARIRKDLGSYGTRLRKAMHKYQGQYLACAGHNDAVLAYIKTKMAIVKKFVAAPSAWFTNMYQKDLLDPLNSAIDYRKFVGDIEDGIKEGCSEFGGAVSNKSGSDPNSIAVVKCGAVVDAITTMIPQLLTMPLQLTQPIGQFSNAVGNLMHTDKAVPKSCTGMQEMAKIATATHIDVTAKQQEYVNLKQQLSLLAGSSP